MTPIVLCSMKTSIYQSLKGSSIHRMMKGNIIICLLLILCNVVTAQQDRNYAPGKITKGKNASYKAFITKEVPDVLFVTNIHCQDTDVLNIYHKNGKKVEDHEMLAANGDFSHSEIREAIHEVFTKSELQEYRKTTPGITFMVKFDEDGKALEVYFIFDYNTKKSRYDVLLNISPDKLYELEKRIRNIVKMKKDDELAVFKNFKLFTSVIFFEEDE